MRVNIHKKLGWEKRFNVYKIVVPLIIMAAGGYFLNALINEGFFIGWEIYFAVGCYASIFVIIMAIDARIIRWMHYSIYIENNRLKIRDGFFSRVISIPLERIFYVNSSKLGDKLHYESLLITDKKINHKKIKPLVLDEISEKGEDSKGFTDLKEVYPDKTFYYYRVCHQGYKFAYYFYMLYKNCERCKFSDSSMEIVKMYSQSK